MNRPTRLLLAAALVGATVGIAGCGASDPTAGAGSKDPGKGFHGNVGTATPAPVATGTASVTPPDELTKTSIGTDMERAMFKKHSVHMVMSLGSEMSMTADTDLAAKSPRVLMSMQVSEDGQQVSINERLIGKVAYVSIPRVTPSGKYYKITAKTPKLGSMMNSIGNLDATKFGATLAADVQKLKYEGTAKIAGATVYKFALTVNGRLALKDLGSLSSLTKAELASAPAVIHETLYLNSDDTLRRAMSSVGGQTMTVNMTRWGKPVHVAAPPASEIAPFTGFSG